LDYAAAIAELNKDKPVTYYLKTFGCQQNEHDSEKIAGLLEKMMYVPSDDIENSDIIVYNTCCVRENAEQKVFGHLGGLKRVKEEKPGTIIAVCGCMMQQEHIVEEIRKKYRHVDIIFGTRALHRFPELLYMALNEKRLAIETGMDDSFDMDCIEPVRREGFKAWISIMTGCNNFCSYCIVPYVRGREMSRNNEKILAEIEMLAGQGCKEVTLLGQNVNSYRDERDGGAADFAGLLYKINDIKGIERIRFMTSHPKDFSIRIAKAMKECEKVCEHLHLPLQAGSNRVLKKMNRKYTREVYLEKVDLLRSEIPDIAITTDIIVGFPGEGDDDFEDTLDMIEKVRYDSAFTFIYSKRKGTPAETLPDQVDRNTAQRRFESLIELQNQISLDINRAYVGKTVEVLVEGLSKTNQDKLTGRTRTNKVVNFSGPIELKGKMADVLVTDAQTWSLEGTLI
jgi:tRNA-2-methylthio-N6-dimethylallyladenosine synthase